MSGWRLRMPCRELFFGLRRNPGALPEALFARLKKSFQAGVLRDAAQTQMLSILREQLNDAGIDFLLLKGAHLKALYPAPELRFMVDMDILVREQDQPRAKDILLANGFTLDFDNGKDIVFLKKPFLTVELHRTLFPEEYRMYPYFLSVWERAEFVGNHEYKMTDNDLYVYTRPPYRTLRDRGFMFPAGDGFIFNGEKAARQAGF